MLSRGINSGGNLTVGRVIAAASIAVGRAASAGNNGANASFTIGFSGGAAAAGTWVILVGATNSGTFTVSGGTNAWTQMDSGSRVWKHLAAASEPATYTVTYSGASKSDCAEASMVEITGANSTNPDASAFAITTSANQSATASASGDIGVICWKSNTSSTLPTAPSGWTIQSSGSQTPSGGACGTVIATKTGLASGSISPGSWSLSGDVGTVLMKA